MSGPLNGVRVLEIGGIGPVPFAGMMLADLGAEVIRVDRPDLGPLAAGAHRILLRGRRMVTLDLKDAVAREAVLALAASSEVLIEGFRPGVMERLGLGPDVVLGRHPSLVYGRMTGWGQDGPWAQSAGHDLTYLAASGALEPIAAPDGRPVSPLNMLGDFGGGSMFLLSGVLAALLHARATGQGQVVDAAIVDGAAAMTAMLHSMRADGMWAGARRGNLLDGGAPFYDLYQTSDGAWLALGALEPEFYALLVAGLDLEQELPLARQYDQRDWPRMREVLTRRIGERTVQEWTAVFDGTDACVCQAISADEVLNHPHLAARATYLPLTPGPGSAGLAGPAVQPAPAPRFSRTPTELPPPAHAPGADTESVLAELGIAL